MNEIQTSISDAELAVLKALWDRGSATVREMSSHLRPDRGWAYTTVLTLLTRLREKGYVASEKSGVAHIFTPAVSRGELLRRQLSEMADRVCDGTASPLVHALVAGQKFSADEISALSAAAGRTGASELNHAVVD